MTAQLSERRLAMYSRFLRLRPVQVAVFLKRMLRISRQYYETSDGRTYWIDPVSGFGILLLGSGAYEPEMCVLFRALLHSGDV